MLQWVYYWTYDDIADFSFFIFLQVKKQLWEFVQKSKK